jgi:hypothetical protein
MREKLWTFTGVPIAAKADLRLYNFRNELSAAQSSVDEVLAGRVPSGT